MNGKRIHFMGVGGVGMAGLAVLLKQAGHDVSGCDKYATARTRWLEANGVPVCIGHDPAHLAGIDELIVTPAVPPSAPELAAARASRTPRVRYRGEVLAERVNAACGIAVCGTHGKTTTSTFVTKLLRALGESPAWCIGGETGAMPVAGPSDDLSDGTLALYRPHVLVLNAVDFDHLEHFSSPEAYFDCYRTAIRNTRRTVVVCAEHPKALALAREATVPGVRLLTFGFAPDADVPAGDWPRLGELVLGRHNVLNALAAIAVALSRGHARAAIEAALPEVLSELPDRRFERVATWRPPACGAPFPAHASDADDSVRIYTDYAHHPAELKCAVDMARTLKPRRLRVLFQPHRYSRTKALQEEFPPAFDAADEIVLIPVYAAFEQPIPGGDIADLYAAFRRRGQSVLLARSRDEAWRHVHLTLQPGDLVLLAGAGDIVALLPRVRADLAALQDLSALPSRVFTPLAPFSFFRVGGATCGRVVDTPAALPAGSARIVAGMGSNSWFSDCADDVSVVRPALPSGVSLLPAHPELAFMAGIPGTVGGWAKMNAGAFGHSVSECIDHVVVELEDGSRRMIPAADCGFAYRRSEIPGVIVEVAFREPVRDAPDMSADYLSRRKKFPPRTCGSVFKNPGPETPAGRLLEAAGAKDLRVGGAHVWSEHANVIVAGDGCTASDILALARLMARAALFTSGIRLEPEIRGLAIW